MPDLVSVERVARQDPKRKGWAVWNVKSTPCCGRHFVFVFPASCMEIECDGCREWIATPALMRIEGRKPDAK